MIGDRLKEGFVTGGGRVFARINGVGVYLGDAVDMDLIMEDVVRPSELSTAERALLERRLAAAEDQMGAEHGD